MQTTLYENVSLVGHNENVQASQGEAVGCASSYSHFTGIYLTVFCCISLCVNVCWHLHGCKAVYLINEVVRQPWIYGGEFSHPFRPAVPGSPQGHRVPLGSHLNWLTGSLCCRRSDATSHPGERSSSRPLGTLSSGQLGGK